MDPLISHLAAAALGLLLLGGAWAHARDLELFRHAIGGYELLPATAERPVAVAITVLEAVAGLALLSAGSRAAGAALAVLLLVAVTGAVIVNLRRGRTELDCGCGGAQGTPLSWGLVLRNALLLGLALLAAVPSNGRPLLGFDAVALVAGTLAVLGAYAAGNQLLANHPRLQRLRSQA